MITLVTVNQLWREKKCKKIETGAEFQGYISAEITRSKSK